MMINFTVQPHKLRPPRQNCHLLKPETTKQNHRNERNGCNDQNEITKTSKTAETTKQDHHYDRQKSTTKTSGVHFFYKSSFF